ncbi:MAG: acyl-CoA reductase [Rikenellaceae bacterium]
MKRIVNIAARLSEAISTFLLSGDSARLIERATEDNPWFSREDIRNSIEAISSQMLNAERLEEWLSHYPATQSSKRRRIAIIMAGNIPLVGFADLLCTLAAGHEAWVKPSSKDRVLMEYICQALKEIDPDIPIYKYDEDAHYDGVIATGGDQANRYFEQKFQSVKRLCRGNRHSVAVLSSKEDDRQLQLLSEDIYSYSGLGCRNVSMIFSPRGKGIKLPTVETHPKYRNNYLQTRALLTLRELDFVDTGCSVIINSKEFPQSLSTISLFEYDSLEEVEQWIEQHDEQLQCIVSRVIKHARCVDFGEAQHPTLFDYADGVDTMKFLEFNN